MEIINGKNIIRTFNTGSGATKVLKGINISIQSGEFVAIMGKSGAGKSTLLYQLSVLDRPTAGSIRIDGQDVLTLSASELARFRLYTLGYIFQDYALIPDLTTNENVLLPLLMRGTDWSTAQRAAQVATDAVGLKDKYGNLPSQLSGGEQQRVAIARAIAGRPKIVFADEPTANLDSISGRAIIELLSKLHRGGQTIVMVTHEHEYTNHCDRVIRLDDGLIVGEELMHTSTTPPLPAHASSTIPVRRYPPQFS